MLHASTPAAPRTTGELFTRYEGNPILTAEQWPYPCNSVFNPAVAQFGSGETVLLVRVEDFRGMSHLTAARSEDGFTNWQIDAAPSFVPEPERYEEEEWGIEDARAVWLEEKEVFAITYTAYSERGPLVSLALTKDFETFERRGAIVPPDDKNAAFFPRRIKGQWALLHRPASATSGKSGLRPHIWISASEDMHHWSAPRSVMKVREGAWWDRERIGIGPPPIETDEGWLLLYHGVRSTTAGDLYRVGLALLDLEDPTKVIRRGAPWIFGPEAPYERIGDVPNAVFPCGFAVHEGEVRLYYGAADTSIAVATAQLQDLTDWILEHD